MARRVDWFGIGAVATVAWLLVVTLVFADGEEMEKVQEQDVARSFSELQKLVRLDDTVWVIDESGREVKGQIEELAPSGLHLTVGDEPLVLREVEVQQVDLRYSDSLKNGAIIGGAVGAGLSAAVLPFCYEDGADGGSCAAANLAFLTGVSVAVGVTIDALRKGRKIVYSAPERPSSIRVKVMPMISKRRKVLLVSIHF